MFKNMKVGKKITLGFGIVLVLMGVLTIVIAITNYMTIKNVDKIQNAADLQTAVVDTLTQFNYSRIQANIVYETVKEENFTNFTGYAKTTEEQFEAALKFARNDKELNKLEKDIQDGYDAFETWKALVTHVAEVNRTQVAYRTTITDNGSSMVAVSNTLLLKAITDPDVDQNAALDLSNYITNFRIYTRELMYSFDVSTVPSIITNIDSATDVVTKFMGQYPMYKSDCQTLIDSLADYKASVYEFETICNDVSGVVATARSNGTSTTETIVNLFYVLDNELNDNITTTSSTALIVLIVVIILAIIAIVSGLILAMVIIKSITSPLEKVYNIATIVSTTGRMRFTDKEMSEARDAISGDEIGQTVDSFLKMLDRLVIIAGELERLAAGDLTIDLKAISSDDTMTNALNNTVDNLNDMFGSINSATDQVSSGSKQIADGAQTLATGSTEQASSIEELSSSIYEIAEATKENAKKASKAANLVESVKTNAEQGEKEMGNMMLAVKEINTSSQDIGKVIKVIDDIAFQTNILALNAAVEAARAGAAGKGFAVVAEEVRNLASKSAEAAKNTSAMISNSIEKAELGTRIANETSASLAKIVSGVMESTTIINDIALSSEEQSMKIDQINIGITQVSEVVQQNSATAEESAAASEEMNGQTTVLSDLVAQFKLK